MVVRFLIGAVVSLLATAPAAGVHARQICLSCHPVHYVERGDCIRCHRGNPASQRKNIAHHNLVAGRYAGFLLADSPARQKGERLMEQFACRRCHVIGDRGNRLSANLDHATTRRSPEELAASIRNPVQNMPDFRATDVQAAALVTALLAASSRQAVMPAARPEVVHFDQANEVGKDLFSIKCGPCHRALTVTIGAVGRGTVGPNLSGLLTTYYPKTFRDGEAWNDERLRRWLENPRAVRPGARMLPVRLTESELGRLLEILRVVNSN